MRPAPGRVIRGRHEKRGRIAEHCRGLIERQAVHSGAALRLLGVPLKHAAHTDWVNGAALAVRPADTGFETRHHLRKVLMICQEDFPGKRHSQNAHPFTAFLVIDIAAEEGVSNRCPFRTSAPPST